MSAILQHKAEHILHCATVLLEMVSVWAHFNELLKQKLEFWGDSEYSKKESEFGLCFGVFIYVFLIKVCIQQIWSHAILEYPTYWHDTCCIRQPLWTFTTDSIKGQLWCFSTKYHQMHIAFEKYSIMEFSHKDCLVKRCNENQRVSQNI